MISRDALHQDFKSPHNHRFVERFFWLLCAYPLLWLSQVYSVGVYEWWRSGHWPKYGGPEYVSPDIVCFLQIIGAFIGFLPLISWPLICPLWTAALVRAGFFRTRRHGWGLLLAVAGGVLTWWEIHADPTGLWAWFMD